MASEPGPIESALREMQQIDPLDLAGRMSDQYGLCGGDCDPKYLERDEWPLHYLDNERIGGVIGCAKCQQVLMTTMGPR